MASISEILFWEKSNRSSINLHLEGLFWRAYQESAFRLQQYYTSYKVLKKYIKAAGQEIVYLGFPKNSLSSVFKEEEIEQVNEKLIRVQCPEADIQEYEKWFSSIEIIERKEIHTKYTLLPEPDKTDSHEEEVIRLLRGFKIEHSTPIECMLFLTRLKDMI